MSVKLLKQALNTDNVPAQQALAKLDAFEDTYDLPSEVMKMLIDLAKSGTGASKFVTLIEMVLAGARSVDDLITAAKISGQIPEGTLAKIEKWAAGESILPAPAVDPSTGTVGPLMSFDEWRRLFKSMQTPPPMSPFSMSPATPIQPPSMSSAPPISPAASDPVAPPAEVASQGVVTPPAVKASEAPQGQATPKPSKASNR